MPDRGCFEIPAEVHARRFDDEIVILHLGVGATSRSAPGTIIWDQLASGKTTDETVGAVLAQYD